MSTTLNTQRPKLIVLQSWLNTLYLSMDTNFKLKQKERGFSNPPLSNRLIYMISNEWLKDHLTHCANRGLVTEVRELEFNCKAMLNLYLSDKFMQFHFQHCQPGIYKVFQGIRCHWCRWSWLRPAWLQATKQRCWPTVRWTVSWLYIVTLWPCS